MLLNWPRICNLKFMIISNKPSWALFRTSNIACMVCKRPNAIMARGVVRELKMQVILTCGCAIYRHARINGEKKPSLVYLAAKESSPLSQVYRDHSSITGFLASLESCYARRAGEDEIKGSRARVDIGAFLRRRQCMRFPLWGALVCLA